MNPATGNALWLMLHGYALEYPEMADDAAKAAAGAFLAEWSQSVAEHSTKCGSCHKKWCLLVSRHPPDMAGRDAFWKWTVAAHDWVNRELGKPIHATTISLQHAIFGIRVPNG